MLDSGLTESTPYKSLAEGERFGNESLPAYRPIRTVGAIVDRPRAPTERPYTPSQKIVLPLQDTGVEYTKEPPGPYPAGNSPPDCCI